MIRPVIPIVPYCLLLTDHCVTPVQTLRVAMIACLFPIDLSRGSHSHLLWLSRKGKKKKPVFAQWCHLKYAGTMDVYWKVKLCINKGWRYFRSAANQNIELLSVIWFFFFFFIFLGFHIILWISLVLCKLGKNKMKRQRATPHWSMSQKAEHGHNMTLNKFGKIKIEGSHRIFNSQITDYNWLGLIPVTLKSSGWIWL